MIESFFKKDLYLAEFEKLKAKISSKKTTLGDYEITESVTLAWVLYNQDFIIDEIIKTLKNRKYKAPIAAERKIKTDEKERTIYAFDLHEKILHGAITTFLNQLFESFFSGSLQSYRKGRGVHNTLLQLSDYIKNLDEKEAVFILRKDIKEYGDSIPHDKLFEVIRKYIPENDYLYDVITKIIKFKYYEFGTKELKTKELGLPTGSPLNNVMTNIFLTDMDLKIDQYSNTSCYFRYVDDIIVATPDKDTADNISRILKETMTDKRLLFNKEKEKDFIFEKASNMQEKFNYLGLMVNSKGKMSFNKEKGKKIKDQIRNLIKKMHIMASDITPKKEEKIKGIINSLRVLLYRTDLLPWLTSYFPVVNDEEYWKELDLWIAKTLLSKVYKRAGDSVFKKYPFKSLREKGLPSMRHLRRLYLNDRKRFYKYISFAD